MLVLFITLVALAVMGVASIVQWVVDQLREADRKITAAFEPPSHVTARPRKVVVK